MSTQYLPSGAKANAMLEGAFAPKLAIRPDLKSPAFVDGEVTRFNIAEMGLAMYDTWDIIVNNYGRQAGYLPSLLEEYGMRNADCNSETLVINRGRDLDYKFRVRGTVTGNGGAYKSVQIEVYGPEGSNKTAISKYEVVELFDGRQYTVLEVTQSSDGNMILNITPKDGVYDLIVTNDQFEGAPDNTYLVAMGRDFVNNGGTDGYAQFQTSTDQEVYYQMKKEYIHNYDGRIMQDQFVAPHGVIPLNAPQFSTTADGRPSGVGLYIEAQQWQNAMRAMSRMSVACMYQQADFNDQLDNFKGGGLLDQVPLSHRLQLTNSLFRDTKYLLNEIVNGLIAGNPNYVSNELILACGPLSHNKILNAGLQDFNITYEMNPADNNRMFTAGRYFNSYVHSSGKVIHVVNMHQLGDIRFSPQVSPYDSKYGARAHDVILMDIGPVMNATPNDLNNLKAESLRKIQPWSQNKYEYQDVFNYGRIDERGENVQGFVTSFNNSITRSITHTKGYALLDKYAITWGSLLN